MLYLDSFENTEDSRTEKKFAICPSIPNIMELVPSKELLAQWQSQEISWEEFRKQFFKEMRVEYSNGEESRLKRLTKYSLENDVTLYSPEPSGQQTYRAILEEIVNIIWKEEGRTVRVVNRALESVEELQLTEADQQQMEAIPQEDEAKSALQEDFARFINKTLSETNESIKSLQEMITNKDEQIQDLQTESHNKDRKNDQLERQINTHQTTIDDLHRTLSEQDGKIQDLQTENDNKDNENDRLKKQIVQLQDLNTHPRIRDIVVKATGNDSVSGEYFRTIDIDNNLPEILRNELMARLKQSLNIGFNDKPKLGHLIKDYTNFDGTDPDKFDESDYYLAHVIRTQRNLIAFGGNAIDERTRIGRAFCCFFAAALLSPKLSKSDHTSAEPPKLIKPKLNDAETHYKRGVTYQKKGDYDRAIAEYTKAIKWNPNYTSAYYNRGTAYYYKSNYDSVIADLTKVIELDPDNANAYYDRAIAYCRKNYYVRAIADLTKVIELKPGNVNAYYNRGHAYQQNGDHTRAQADFDKATQLKK